MNIAIHEKRREIREPAEGPVLVRFANPQPLEILGQLMDVSASGFRMAHANQALQSGQIVEFSHSLAVGAAPVAVPFMAQVGVALLNGVLTIGMVATLGSLYVELRDWTDGPDSNDLADVFA